MLIDYLQFAITALIAFAIPVALATIIKIYIEKIVLARKLWDFFWHIAPAILFLFLASKKEVWSVIGEAALGDSTFGFVFLFLLGIHSLVGAFLFAYEIFNGKHFGEKIDKQKGKSQDKEKEDQASD